MEGEIRQIMIDIVTYRQWYACFFAGWITATSDRIQINIWNFDSNTYNKAMTVRNEEVLLDTWTTTERSL